MTPFVVSSWAPSLEHRDTSHKECRHRFHGEPCEALDMALLCTPSWESADISLGAPASEVLRSYRKAKLEPEQELCGSECWERHGNLHMAPEIIKSLVTKILLRISEFFLLFCCGPLQDVVQGHHGNVLGDRPHSACDSHT